VSAVNESQQSAFLPARMVFVLTAIAVVAALAMYSARNLETDARQESLDRTTSNFLSNLAPLSVLDDVYRDADGNLLADPPENPELCLKPAELTFSFIASDDDVNTAEVWQTVLDALKQRTGLPVKYLQIEQTKDQLAALRNGALHVTAFGSGAVPTAVNSCGFTPICTFGRADGSYGYTMQFIVKSDSPIQDLAELRGKRVVFTRPNSNSGYKAALVLLMQKYDMLPERDYQWRFLFGHVEAMAAVAAGEADAAPIASDIFAREAAKGTANAGDFRVIYESERFPPVAFGYAYNLTPELRQAIREALLELPWAGTKLETEFGGDEAAKFVKIDYKDDWANIRRVDEAAANAKQRLVVAR
jgi:phosphonate transport system substrate-binding protein